MIEQNWFKKHIFIINTKIYPFLLLILNRKGMQVL